MLLPLFYIVSNDTIPLHREGGLQENPPQASDLYGSAFVPFLFPGHRAPFSMPSYHLTSIPFLCLHDTMFRA